MTKTKYDKQQKECKFFKLHEHATPAPPTSAHFSLTPHNSQLLCFLCQVIIRTDCFTRPQKQQQL